MTKKILTIEFRHETNSFCPTPADANAYKNFRWWVGEEVASHCRNNGTEMSAFLDVFDSRKDMELIHSVALCAMPSGPVTKDVYDFVVEKVLAIIQSHDKFDGILLDIHGAMVADGHPDGEGDLMALLRQKLGTEIPLIASLDLHANVTAKMAQHATALIPYNTYPHVDIYETGEKAARLMEKTLDGVYEPVMAYRRIPYLMPLIPSQSKALEPLYNFAEELEKTPGILSLRFSHGFFPADMEEMGLAVMAVTDNDPELAEQIADTMAQAIRDRLPQLKTEYMDLDAALDIAEKEAGPVVLADASDNPGAGGIGDTTHILRRILDRGITGAAVATILDPVSVEICTQAGEGATVQLHLGGWSDSQYSGGPLEVTAVVKKLTDGKYVLKGPMNHGMIADQGNTAVVEIGGNLVLITSLPRQPFDLEVFRSHGIDPAQQKILVTKSSIHYRISYGTVAKTMIPLALSGYASPIPENYCYRNWKAQ